MHRFFAVLLVCVAIALPPAEAAMVTLRAKGTVGAVNSNDGLLPFPVSTGDAFVIDYTFDDAVADSAPTFSYGYYYNPIFTMTLAVGGVSYSFVNVGGLIAVLNDEFNPVTEKYMEQYYVLTDGGAVYTGVLSRAELSLLSDGLSTPLDVFASDALPTTGFDVTAFGNRNFVAHFDRSENGNLLGSDFIEGTVDSLERVNDVPLPAAAWLLLSGLTGLGVLGRGRRRKAAESPLA